MLSSSLELPTKNTHTFPHNTARLAVPTCSSNVRDASFLVQPCANDRTAQALTEFRDGTLDQGYILESGRYANGRLSS